MWVEIRRVVLAAGERAPHVPSDTQQVPLEMRVKGRLVREASVGDEAEVVTATGRRIVGVLIAVNPAYTHRFGSVPSVLSPIGSELREILRGSTT
jgi:hypothetical protein